MKNIIVVYAGGFQPFHQGHLASYLQAKNAFPKADFYVAASADTKKRPIPYPEKKFLAVQAGVQPEDFPNVIVKSPLKPDEILKDYDPEEDVFVLVRSERDPMSYTKKDGSPGYYQPWQGLDKAQPFGKHGYVFVTPKHDFAINGEEVYSGTQVRNLYAKTDDKGRNTIIKQLYPQSKDKKTIKNILDIYIGEEMVLEVNKIYEYIHRIKPYLEEASKEQKIKIYKLLSEAKRKIEEGQIYSTGGGAGQSYRYSTPRHVPNQNEIDKVKEDSGFLPFMRNILSKEQTPVYQIFKNGKPIDNKKYTLKTAKDIIHTLASTESDITTFYWIMDTQKTPPKVVYNLEIVDTIKKTDEDYLEEN